MKREIHFASRKGGTGKSTLCALVANHLEYHGKKVLVVDCDNCSTLTWKRKGDMKSFAISSDALYPIISGEEYYKREGSFDDFDYVLFDNDSRVGEGRPAVMVVPFIYTEMVVDSTFRFVREMSGVKNCDIFFLPNEVNGYKQSIKKKDIVETINWMLGIFGTILPKVGNSRLFDQVDTVGNIDDQNQLIKDFVNKLLPECPMTEEQLDHGKADLSASVGGDMSETAEPSEESFEPQAVED